MTIKYDLTKAHRRKEIITVCAVSQQQFNKGDRKTLEFKLNNTWITTKPPVPDYKNYSHGICLDCVKEHYPKHYDKINKLYN